MWQTAVQLCGGRVTVPVYWQVLHVMKSRTASSLASLGDRKREWFVKRGRTHTLIRNGPNAQPSVKQKQLFLTSFKGSYTYKHPQSSLDLIPLITFLAWHFLIAPVCCVNVSVCVPFCSEKCYCNLFQQTPLDMGVPQRPQGEASPLATSSSVNKDSPWAHQEYVSLVNVCFLLVLDKYLILCVKHITHAHRL